jgi:O-antigen/teichoic acid export membrane protein
MSFRKTAMAGVKWTTVDRVGKAVFQLLQVAILTRFLPKEAFGLIAMALVVINFTNIFVDMGMTSAILFKQDANQKEYSSIYWLNVFVSALLFGLLLFVTPFIASFYEESELLYIIPILGANILLVALGRQHRTIMQKEFRFKPIAIVELTAYFLGLIVAVVLAYRGAGVYSLVYSTLTASTVSNLLFLGTNIRSNPISMHFKFQETVPFLRVGGYQTGSKILDFISQESDIFIVGKMLGAEILGVYSLSKQIVLKLFSLINPIIVNVLSPLLSSIQNEKERVKKTFLKIIQYLAYLTFPIYFIIMVSSEEILFFLYGSSYVEASLVLSFLAVYYCLISLSNPVGSLQIATGRTDIGFIWTILRVFVTPMFIFLGAIYNIEGVAFSIALLGVLLLIPLWYIQIRPMANISLVEYFQQFYKPLIIFIILGFVVIILQQSISIAPSILSLISKILLSISLFIGILFIIDNKSVKIFYKFGSSMISKK